LPSVKQVGDVRLRRGSMHLTFEDSPGR
jgi:hypothetical protein